MKIERKNSQKEKLDDLLDKYRLGWVSTDTDDVWIEQVQEECDKLQTSSLTSGLCAIKDIVDKGVTDHIIFDDPQTGESQILWEIINYVEKTLGVKIKVDVI